MAYSEISHCSDETVDFRCTLCNKKGYYKQAINYCDDCRDYFCQTCTDAHNKDHGQHTNLLKEVDFPFTGRKTDANGRCSVHTMELLNKYCKDHDDIGCEICISQNHRSCSSVICIHDMDKHHEITIDHAKITERLSISILRMKEVKNNKDKTLTKIFAARKQATDTVKKFRKDLERVLDELEKASLEEIETDYDTEEIRVRNQIQEGYYNVERLEEAFRRVKYADHLNSEQMFVSIKYAERMLSSLEQSEKALSSEPQPVNDSFQLNTNISRYLRDLQSFKIEQTSIQVQNSKDIDVQMDGETCSLIHDSCFTPDGILLLADFNKKLKRVHVRRECIIDYFDLPARPWGICCTDLYEAAVCLDNNTVQMVSLGRQMTLTKQFTFKHTCCGVAYSDGELFISDRKQTVFIYNMKGKLLRKIHCRNIDWNKLITYDETTRRLYIAAGDSMLITDILGSSISIFKDPNVKDIRSVCADGRGGVFLCVGASNNVILLDKDGRKLRYIVGLLDEIDNPSSVCFNRIDAELCVTGRIIKMFDLKYLYGRPLETAV